MNNIMNKIREDRKQNSGCGGRSGCKNPPADWHPCPYQEEINDNFEDYCTCCEECEDECRDDI